MEKVPRGELRAIVQPQRFRRTATSNDITENACYPLARQRCIGLYGQAFPREVINNAEYSECAACGESVTYKIQGPLLVRSRQRRPAYAGSY
jgi:hypothetical protein